jgi:hypothetical protein
VILASFAPLKLTLSPLYFIPGSGPAGVALKALPQSMDKLTNKISACF